MLIGHRFEPISAANVGVHATALNGAWANECHLHHQIKELPRLQSGQGGQLRARFHLKHAHRVRTCQHLVNLRFSDIYFPQVHSAPMLFIDQVNAMVDGLQHSEAKQVELHQSRCRTVILIPLHY